MTHRKTKLYTIISGAMIATVLVFAIHPFTATAAVARVQAFSGTDTTFASTVTTSPTVTVTAGDLIICGASADVATSMTLTDSKSNTWNRIQTNNIASTLVEETWWAKATTGGSGYSVTATSNGGDTDSEIICEEWSGQDLTSPADAKAQATGVASTAMNSGASGATTVANEIVVGVGSASGAPTLTLGAGYSNLTRVATSFTALGFESKIVSATGAQTSTMTAGASASWSMHVATFKEAVAAGGSTGAADPRSVILFGDW